MDKKIIKIGDKTYTMLIKGFDDEVEIDLEQVADAVCKKAKKEGQGDYKADEVFFVVQADLDYQEQTL